MAAHGHERRFLMPVEVEETGSAVMEPHVKLGRVGSPRLHFIDDLRRSVTIYFVYIGPVLTNTQTN